MAKVRMEAMSSIRSFFVERGFLEVETPLLVASPDMDPSLTPFETIINRPGEKSLTASLVTSPEYSMKKLLGSGFEKIFSIGPVFRDAEVWDATHVSEFTMLEWYEAGIDYNSGMRQTEDLVKEIARTLGVVDHICLGTWKKISVKEIFSEQLGISNVGNLSVRSLKTELERRAIHFIDQDTWSDLFYRLFVTLIEPNLPDNQVTILYDYPIHQAALARHCADGVYAERFEVYLGKLELCNAFTELTDSKEQRKRFIKEQQERKRLGKTIFPVDEGLLRLLPSLQSPTFGNALGFDRLLMSLLGKKSINEVLLFPPDSIF
ncbi:MAG: EF-P lysine aminoacylase EpmA [bacterium]|nr:EF-P lysine aminoacylase EpmA [bacterium]